MNIGSEPDGRDTDRGVSEVVGAILIFGLVLAVLALVQLNAVPAANEEVEFDHNQRVQNDMVDLQQAADITGEQDTSRTVSIEAGVNYPNRFILLNPPASAGSVQADDSSFSIENAVALDNEAAEFWPGTRKTYDSKNVTYRPAYNYYDSAPDTVYEHGIVHNNHPDGKTTTLIGTGSVVDGNRITLVAVDGNLSTATPSTLALETVPLNAPMQTVSIRDDGSPVTLQLQTGMTKKAWGKLLNPQLDKNVSSWSYDDGGITITLEQDVVYDLRMAEIGVGSDYSDEPPAYLAGASVKPRFVELGGNTLAVEARDKFNTVESGVDVEFVLEEGDGYFINDQGQDAGTSYTVTTRENGQAKVAFKPTASAPVTISATADFGYPGATPDKNETVHFEDIAVIGGGGGGDEDTEFNPADSDAFELTSAVLQEESVGLGQGNKSGVVYMTFKNRGNDTGIEAVRINSFVQNAKSANNQKQPAYALINGTKVNVGGDYVQTFEPGFQVDFTQGQEETYRAVFYEPDGDPYDFTEADFFVYSIRFEDGSVSRYFVVPNTPD